MTNPVDAMEAGDVKNGEDLIDENTPLVTGKSESSRPRPHVDDEDITAIEKWTGIGPLRQAFGTKLLFMLFVSQHLMKGFANSYTGPAMQFLYKSYNVPAPQIQIFSGVVQLPWAMKPVIGLCSDVMPIMGYNKMPYMLLATVAGLFGCACIGTTPHDALPISSVVWCLFLISVMYSTNDLLTEARYSESLRTVPEHGPNLLTYVWFGMSVGALAGTLSIGSIIKHFGPRLPYLIALLPSALILFPLMKNYLEERPRTAEQTAEHRKNMLAQKEALALCLLMFVCTMTLTFLGTYYEDVHVNAIASIIVAVVVLVSFSVVLRPIIAKVNALAILQTSMGLSIGGASFYFYTDGPEQFPDGPHFSEEFFVSVLGSFGMVMSMVGIYTYNRFATTLSYRSIFLVTNIVLSVLSLIDLIIFTRWNLKIGIPDHLFVLGGTVFETIIGQWMWMPSVVLMSQLCPQGMEATMFALLAGCNNLGNTISSNCGALVLKLLNVEPSGAADEAHQFENLWLAGLISTVLPLFTVFLIPYLIPDAKQTEKLLPDGDRSATKDSILRRWLEGNTRED